MNPPASVVHICPRRGVLFLLLVAAHVYVAFAIYRNPTNGIFLLALLGKAYSFLFAKIIYSNIWPKIRPKVEHQLNSLRSLATTNIRGIPITRWLLIVSLLCFIVWTLYGVVGSSPRTRAVGALLIYILIAVAISESPTKVVSFLDVTFKGTAFVYGYVGTPPPICHFPYVLIFTALQIVIFFGAVVSLLYHYGIIQVVLSRMATIMRYSVGTTAAESLNATACIFLGQTEAALLIAPSLPSMSSSELHTVMTTGFACIAGSLFSAFIAFGACPTYLLSATLMSACVSLSISKIIYPETENREDEEEFRFAESNDSNLLECVSEGAEKSAGLVLAIGANLLSFLALLQCTNAVLTHLGELVGFQGLTLNWILSRLLFPLAYMMGASDSEDSEVALKETMMVAELMGMKTVLNEFIAYSKLAELVNTGQLVGARARMIATFACCGFANIPMIGNTLGTMGQLVPGRRKLLAQLVVRALASGVISCFVTATVAGIIVDTPIECHPQVRDACFDLRRVDQFINNITMVQ